MSVYTDWSEPTADSGLVVMLPGRGYTCAMPLLNFAGQVADSHGWAVREVAWQSSEQWRTPQVGEELAAAIGDHRGPVRVIGKSLGTMAAPYAAEHRIAAIWLTPLVKHGPVAQAIDAHQGRQLLIGGTGDTMWDGEIAASLPAQVLEIADANHSLQVSDPVRTAEIHVQVVRAMDRWFAEG